MGNGANSAAVIFSDVISMSDNSQPNLNRYATIDNVGDNPSYVGWTYQLSNQRPTSITSETSSNAKTQTENWYKDTSKGNLKAYEDKIADGKFCNDRNIGSGSWTTSNTKFFYAGYTRLVDNKNPTFDCPKEDAYTLKVGAITADEIIFAGGTYESDNDKYYLYNGQSSWTMSPDRWLNGDASVFVVGKKGGLYWPSVYGITPGLRPVINLKVDVTFSSGNGKQLNPYIVQ